jgi:fructose-1,6-bisphosphatase I
MIDDPTFVLYTDRYAQQDPLRRAVAVAINALANASIEISELIARGALAGITGRAQGRNADGDEQKDLDVRADQIIRHALKSVSYAALASEEAETPEIGDAAALISIAYDPLDGSSNIETNMTVGTIFSILPHRSTRLPFTGPGSEQLAAGLVLYGPQTSLVLTLGRGVDVFTSTALQRILKFFPRGPLAPAKQPSIKSRTGCSQWRWFDALIAYSAVST